MDDENDPLQQEHVLLINQLAIFAIFMFLQSLKGIVSVILSDTPWRDVNARLTAYP